MSHAHCCVFIPYSFAFFTLTHLPDFVFVQQSIGMASFKGMRSMDDLPDEWFANILHLVSISDVIADMRVSKRWAAACRYIIRKRESLIIGNEDWYEENAEKMRGWDWHKNRPSEKLDSITVANQSLVPAMMKSLSQMENITRLCVSSIGLRGISPSIQKFAQQLTMLEVDFAINVTGSNVFPHLKQLSCWHFYADTAAAFPKLTELVIREEGEKMPGIMLPTLKRLLVLEISDGEQMNDFLVANSKNLECMAVGLYEPEFDHEVVFENVTDLYCWSMGVEMVKAFPAIKHLNIRESTIVPLLSRLPAAQMLSLNVSLRRAENEEKDDFEEEDADELEACAAVIAGMVILAELSISFSSDLFSIRSPDTNHALSIIFNGLHQLEKLSILARHENFRLSDMLECNEVISSLVRQNPGLRDIRFVGMDFTSACFASLSQLHHLSHIHLDICFLTNNDSDREQILTDAVLTLLRGSSRKVIRELTVWNTDVDVDQVTREVELMAQERKTTFEELDDHHVEFVIHA